MLGAAFRPGFKFSKAEVLLVNLRQKGGYADDLFTISQPESAENVMGFLDAINGRWGWGTMRLASVLPIQIGECEEK